MNMQRVLGRLTPPASTHGRGHSCSLAQVDGKQQEAK